MKKKINKSNTSSVVIESIKGWVSLQLKNIWEYRELLYFLTWRDIKIRYKQTALGAIWAFLQPLLTMVVFSIFFGKLAGIPSDGIPYPIFTYAALLPWQFFSNSITQSGNSLVSNQQLITKVYFPRLIIPISSVNCGIVDFGFAFVILIVMMFIYGIIPSILVITLPLFLLLTYITTLAVSFWLAVLNVKYRDVRYMIPFLTQFWLFATPIAYPVSLVPEQWRLLYSINPMVGVVGGFRWALFGNDQPPDAYIFISIFVTVTLLIGGVIYFKKMEKTFADII